MKRIIMTKFDFMKIAVPVIAIVSLVLIMASCGAGHISCDAYGQNDLDNGITEENSKS